MHADRRTRGGRHSESPHQRLRAVVPGPDAHAVAREDLGHVVRVHAIDRERDGSAARLVDRPDDRDARHLGQPIERLAEVPGLRIFGPATQPRGPAISFALEGVHPHDVAEILGRDGICVRAGHHCAQPLMRRLRVSATSRASFAVHNTDEDVDALIAGLAKVKDIFA